MLVTRTEINLHVHRRCRLTIQVDQPRKKSDFLSKKLPSGLHLTARAETEVVPTDFALAAVLTLKFNFSLKFKTKKQMATLALFFS